MGALLGNILGFCACCNTESDNGFSTWFVLSFCGAIIGIPLAHISTSISAKVVSKIHAQTEQEISLYKKEFEAEAQRMSIGYSKNTVVTGVANIISDRFIKAIIGADRSPHIEKVSIRSDFVVNKRSIYYDKFYGTIFSNSLRSFNWDASDYADVYDFFTNRYADLESPLERAAVARAIVPIVESRIGQRFRYVGAAVFSLDANYFYSGDNACVTITYTEQNHNYRPVQSW